MSKKQIYLTIATITIVSNFVFVVFASPIDSNAMVTAVEKSWIDNFDSGTLDSRWTWVRENPAYWSLTANPGFLRLTTRGSLHQTSNDLENILLTPVSGIDYRIITKVTFSPMENNHRAGLLVYEDDDNYIQLTRVYTDGDHVRIKTEIGGVNSYTYASDVVAATTLYLRLDKYANDYYGFYSLDGVAWEFIGQYNLPLSNTYVGLFAAYGPTVTEIDADFDYFEFIPRTYNTTWVDEFDSTTLNSSWSWIKEDPTHWSLANNPGFLQIITQNGGIFSATYHNLLVKDAPSEDYRITTKATISPTEDFQGASIIVYSDDNNYIRLGRRFASPASGDEVNFRHESNDVLVEHIPVIENATTLYLRITKEGNVYSGFYSVDGDSYTYIGQTTAVFTNHKIGILSENGPSTTEIPSDYDFFRLETNSHLLYLPLVKR